MGIAWSIEKPCMTTFTEQVNISSSDKANGWERNTPFLSSMLWKTGISILEHWVPRAYMEIIPGRNRHLLSLIKCFFGKNGINWRGCQKKSHKKWQSVKVFLKQKNSDFTKKDGLITKMHQVLITTQNARNLTGWVPLLLNMKIIIRNREGKCQTGTN